MQKMFRLKKYLILLHFFHQKVRSYSSGLTPIGLSITQSLGRSRLHEPLSLQFNNFIINKNKLLTRLL